MAKRQKAMQFSMPTEPTPKQEMDWAMERAVEKVVMAHPRTKKLREAIKQRMVKAAGCETDAPAGKTSKKKR